MKILKRCLIFSLLFLPFILFFFYQPLVSFGSQGIVKFLTARYLNESMKYEEAFLEGNKLILIQPHFEKNDRFKAEKMIFECTFNTAKREINLAIKLEKPCWTPDPEQLKWETLKAFFESKGIFIRINPSLDIQDGVLAWRDPDQIMKYVQFNLKGDRRSGGMLSVYLDQSDSSHNFFTVEAFNRSKILSIIWNCQHVQCQSLMTVATLLFPQLHHWVFESGTLHGQIKAVFPSKQKPYLDGQMALLGAQFSKKDSHLKGFFDEVQLQLAGESGQERKGLLEGYIEIIKPASLVYGQDEKAAWQLDQIKGKISLDGAKQALIQLQANSCYQQHQSQLLADGYWQMNADQLLNMDVNLTCFSPDQPKGQMRISLHPSISSQIAQIECHQLSYIECGFFQTLLATYWPALKRAELKGGIFSGLAHFEVSKKGFNHVQFKNWQIQNFKFHYAPWHASFYFPHWTGEGTLEAAAEKVWPTLYADLHAKDGQITFEGMHPITQIETHLKIKKGEVEHSSVNLKWANLKGHLDVEWGSQQELLALNLRGQVLDLADLLPVRLQAGIQRHFNDHPVQILAELKRQAGQLQVEGLLSLVKAGSAESPHLIHFGGLFKKSLQPTGWFYSDEVPVETFIAPFLFDENTFQLRGLAAFKGSFSPQDIVVEYKTKHIQLENKDLLIEMPSAGFSPIVGTHRFDLTNYSHQGNLPLKDASYLEKNHRLLFTDIQGEALFKDQTIALSALEMDCQGLYLNGSLLIDYSNPLPKTYTIKCHFPSFHGSLTQMKQVLAQLNPSSQWLHFPLEGEIEGKDQGLHLAFDFQPEDVDLQAHVQGTLTNGTMPISNSHLALQALYADLDYQHAKKELLLTDLQGMLILGKGQQAEEYQLAGTHLCCQQGSKQGFNWDIWVNNASHQICRLCAQVQEQENGIQCQVNTEKSHFSGICPTYFELNFKDWDTVDTCHIRAQFPLEAVFADMQLFFRTGLILPDDLQRSLAQVKIARGDCQLAVDYESRLNYCDYQLTAHHLNWNTSVFDFFNLKGKKQDKTWIIDQLQLDHWSLAAEIQNKQDKWKVNFLGLSNGQAFLLGLEGDLDLEERSLKGKINLFEASLAQLSEQEFFQTVRQNYYPSGQIKGSGTLKAIVLNESPWLKVESAMQLHAQDLKIRDYALPVMQPFSLDLISDQKIFISHLNIQLEEQGQLLVEQLCYDWQQDRLSCPLLTIQIPCHLLGTFANKCQAAFPELCQEKLKKFLSTCRREGVLKTTLAFEKNPQRQFLSAKLNDGLYWYKKRPYDLKNFELKIDQDQLTFSTLTHEERCPFSIEGNAHWPDLEQGHLILKETSSTQPLLINWTDYQEEGLRIASLEGDFAGLGIHLKAASPSEQQPGWSVVKGAIHIHFNQFSSLLSKELAERILTLELGPLYTVEGKWRVNSEEGLKFLEMIHFQGKIHGQEAILKGYQVEKLEAELFYAPQRLDVKQFWIEDASGQLSCSECAIVKQQDQKKWMLVIPRLAIKNFRPSLLREPASMAPSQFKTLLIRRIILNDFYGELEEIATWRANGVLNFLNPSRKNFSHPLFTIPAELILRIGLNPDVLNPVTGTIFFNLQGDRFILDKFKDVYSEGRGSKFYLAKGIYPSWMNFKGDLSVQIRMKQYNLLFKIAELFTVSIQGNIKKPKYTLQKQEKS